MTNLAIVGYPIVSEPDREWVESIRVEHDPQTARIAAHFTLDFPTRADAATVAARAADVCETTSPIRFTLCRAEAVRDVDGFGGHVFLVPVLGREEFIELHRRLHDGASRDLVTDVFHYAPHITVAAKTDFAACVALAREITNARRTIEGVVDRLHLISLGSDSIRCLRTLSLAGPRADSTGGRARRA